MHQVISPVNDIMLKPCPASSYRASNASVCQPCPAGTVSTSQYQCTACPPGKFAYLNQICSPCPAATYMPFGGATACLNCSISSAVGATVCGCGAEYYYLDGICRLCAFRCAVGGGVVKVRLCAPDAPGAPGRTR